MVQKDTVSPHLEETLDGPRPSRSSAKIIDETNASALQRYRCAPGRYKHSLGAVIC